MKPDVVGVYAAQPRFSCARLCQGVQQRVPIEERFIPLMRRLSLSLAPPGVREHAVHACSDEEAAAICKEPGALANKCCRQAASVLKQALEARDSETAAAADESIFAKLGVHAGSANERGRGTSKARFS